MRQPAIGPIKSGVEIKLRPVAAVARRVISKSLGPHTMGVALFRTDPGDRDTMLAGALKRFLAQVNTPRAAVLIRYAAHVRKFCSERVPKLDPATDFSVESWLEESNYPLWRREQILEAYYANQDVLADSKNFEVDGFMKDEGYMEVKHARGINSRTDAFKAEVGPIFHRIEELIFKLPEFVKYVPVRDRPHYLMERLYHPGIQYVITDFTTFEAGFRRIMMLVGEFQLFLHIVFETPVFLRFLFCLWIVIGGRNVCTFKFFLLFVWATRMSGEMCTSSANGSSNLMMFDFVAAESRVTYVGAFEGDDGIAAILRGEMREELFTQLGMKIKLEVVTELCDASFCGLVFDPKDLLVVTDPHKVLANYAWSNSRYVSSGPGVLKQLLRAKGLSMAYSYPGCPIVTSIAKYILRVTREIKIKRSIVDNMDSYSRGEFLRVEAFGNKLFDFPDIPMTTRLVCERKFKVTVEQQLAVEELFDSKSDFLPVDINVLDFHRDLHDYFDSYAIDCPRLHTGFVGEWWSNFVGFLKEWDFVEPLPKDKRH